MPSALQVRPPPPPLLPADFLAVSQALYTALAIHTLREQSRQSRALKRRAALSVDYDRCGGSTVVLVAEPTCPPTPTRGRSRE